MYKAEIFNTIDGLLSWLNEHKPEEYSITVDSHNNWWIIYKK